MKRRYIISGIVLVVGLFVFFTNGAAGDDGDDEDLYNYCFDKCTFAPGGLGECVSECDGKFDDESSRNKCRMEKCHIENLKCWEECFVIGEFTSECGDDICYEGEDCATCPNDCPCDTGTICNPSDSNADAYGCVGEGVAFTINVQAPGYLPWSGTLATKDYEPSSITLEGVVKDEEGNPVSGATISIPDLGKSVTSGVQGNYKLYVETEGTKPYADELDWVLEQSPVTLQITADPLYFKTKGDEVEVTITVLDSESRAVIGEPVEIEPQQISIEGILDLTTDATGSVRFTATHLDAQLFEYTYIVRAMEVEKTFTLQVFGARVELNRDAVPPFEPYRGVVADDESRLKIFLNFPDTQDDIVRVSPPPIGTLAQIKNGQEEDVVSTIFLDGLGRAELVYTPPAYLSDDQLDHSVDVHDYDNAALARGAKVNVVFEYTDISGNPGTDALEFGVYRPPVLLLHGFLGGLGTWTDFAKHLEPQFDAVLGEYFVVGDDTDDIRANARRLKGNIEKQKIDYAFSGIMLHKVDLVVHSMGGLISRNYIEQAGDYGNDVRKLIMVATPNHGSSLLDIKLGALAALWFDKHKVASQQLYSGSGFIKQLNAGEQTGAHLANNVQYANLIGKMYCYPKVHGECLPGQWRETDGVVTTASARLNGVVSYVFEGTKHSGDLVVYPLDESVTTDGRIWAKTIQLLQEDIAAVPLRGSRVEITKARGDVVLNPDTLAIPVSSTPTRLEPWASLRTGADGEAVIALTIGHNVYGKTFLHHNSEILFDYASPDYVRVFLRRGSALFRSFRQEGAGLIYDLPLGVQPYEGKWYEITPKARVTHRETEFVVNIGQDIQVFSLDGRVVVESYDNVGTATFQELTTDQGATVQENGVLQPLTAMPEAWWENSFYQLEPLEDQSTTTALPFPAHLLLFATGGVAGLAAFALLIFLLVTRRRPAPAAPPVPPPARPVRPRGRPEELVSRRPPAWPEGPPERLGGGKPSGPPETLD